VVVSSGEDYRARSLNTPHTTPHRAQSPRRQQQGLSPTRPRAPPSRAHQDSHQDHSPAPPAPPTPPTPPALRKRPKVTLVRNDGGMSNKSKVVLLYTLRMLLDEAAAPLELTRSARKIYTVDGTHITSVSQIEDGMVLVISTGEKFRVRGNKPTLRRAPGQAH